MAQDMQLSRRFLLAGVAATALSGPSAFAQNRPVRVGVDADGVSTAADRFPGDYVVKAPPVPAGTHSFATVRQGRLQGVLAGGIRYFRGIP